jgi:hypothetical protein
MKKLETAFSDQFDRLQEKVTWRAGQLGIDLGDDEVIENLLSISNGATDADGKINESWEVASWPDRIFAMAFRCSNENLYGDASYNELIDALCLGNWAIGFVDGLPGEKPDPHVCVPCLIKQHSSAIGKSGAQKRHAPMAELRAWTIEQYRAGKWPSANKAAHDLKDSVIARGRAVGANLTEENAQRTIAEWIRKSV